MAENTQIDRLQQEVDRLLATINAHNPSPKSLADLQAALAKAPQLVEEVGDMGLQVQMMIMDRLASDRPGARLAIHRRAAQVSEELGYAASSPIERLLINQVMTCWLRLQEVEVHYHMITQGQHATSQAQHWERRLTAVQHRYLKALESLARVRMLLRRAPVQINIAQRQVVKNG